VPKVTKVGWQMAVDKVIAMAYFFSGPPSIFQLLTQHI